MQFLEKHFDIAFAAPDGINKLRELILTLAMQGKLVPQDLDDQPACVLLKAIEIEKKRLVKEGKIKAPKSLPEIRPDEVPNELPKGWVWVRIRDICHDWGQKTPDRRFTYIDVGSIDNKIGVIGKEVQVLESHEAPSRARKLVQKGTVIYSTVRPYLLNIAIIESEYEHDPIASTAFAILHPFVGVNNRFIYSYLRSPAFIRYVESTMKGVAYPAINDSDFFQGVFPLPPLAEQRRIVAKIDQLMARCVELEKLRAEREQKRHTVHTAALNLMLTATDSSDFNTAWRFITQHFGELYSVKENVAELRKAILQLAVMGKLVPQDSHDQPARELLKEIEAEKKRLVKEGKIKAGSREVAKNAKGSKPEAVPYELPLGWEWLMLGSAISYMDAGWSPKCEFGPASDAEWGVLKTTAVQPLQFWSHENKALPKKLTPRPEAQVVEGDILITRAGPKNRVGICCVAKPVRPLLMLSDKIIRIRIFGDLIYSEFCALCLNTGYGREQIENMKSGMADSQMNISQDKVKLVVIPLPPLAEQHHIVAKIDQLMALCDAMEKQIDAATGKRTDLLNAVMSQV